MRSSAEFEDAVKAAEEFVNTRTLESVKNQIQYARLYVSAFRSLDVYAPIMGSIQRVAETGELGGYEQDVKVALKGLSLLYSARYHRVYQDHRIFPTLYQYVQALELIEDGLYSAKDSHTLLKNIYENFVNAAERITLGNGIYVVNWKEVPDYHFTLYKKVGLRIARLIASEFIGLYVVKVRDKAPLHYHRFLDEHHFLPEYVEGLHYLDGKVCKTTQTDILYIRKEQVHGFKNKGAGEAAFVFVCGSKETGPWDFVQDIELVNEEIPDVGFDNIDDIGGRDLYKVLEKVRSLKQTFHERLSPEYMHLFQEVVGIRVEYVPHNKDRELICFVAEGDGTVEVEGRSHNVRSGDTFLLLSNTKVKILSPYMILYQFGYE
ncbi:MAG: AraC family ligand binding domain-containing protein [Nitrososphaerota archaeon]|nr:AraC family ligand binding domain-containing protein [Aigarchaeota archaeon]MDW8076324.1 AraC family ligand binding domain-containing protein [Nitrososphaerota archaeon]